jgi:Family of unknown function (DUF6406)
MGIGMRVPVSGGTVFRRDGLSFGGSNHFPATDTKPERIIVSMWDGKSNEQKFELSVGETLEFSGQSWRLDEIDDEGRRWYATLTRVA